MPRRLMIMASRLIAAAVMAAALTACGTRYEKLGASEAEIDRDLAACRYEAQMQERVAWQAVADQCMVSRGYTLSRGPARPGHRD